MDHLLTLQYTYIYIHIYICMYVCMHAVGIESGCKKGLSKIESCPPFVSRLYLIAFHPVFVVVSTR